jgi:hypothetical protein
MAPTPKTLDYFKLGCAAGNFVVIFTSPGVQGQLLTALRRCKLTRLSQVRPITKLLKDFANGIPERSYATGGREFEVYCTALMDLREIVLYQGNRTRYQWYVLGDALYRLATASGLTPNYPIDKPMFTFETAVAQAKPPKAIASMCDNFSRLASRRRGDHNAVFGFAGKVESFIATHLTVSFD